ncbi:sterile alpha motif domain-containing protein 9-like [Haliotis cracherodii]|uniref:sterile alpha motif domain-containing protein 9-like n=1 Tax=Haliotis cracherodii TaxID=6455 RepID=UPI0039EA4A60
MDSKEWRRIMKNWVYLKSELQLEDGGDILNGLFQNGTLNDSEYKLIKSISPEPEKVERLLFTLKRKPQNLNAYKRFCDIVREIQPHIEEKLAATPDEDACLEADQPQTEDVVRGALLDRFINRKGSTCPLPDVKAVIKECVTSAGVNYDWGDKQLRDLITQVFTDTTWQQRSKREIPYLRNLQIRPSQTPTKPRLLSTPTKENVKLMQVDGLCDFLNNHPTVGKKEDVIAKCKDECITGEVFLSLKETDINELFPSLKFGHKRALSLLISNIKSQPHDTENANTEQSVIESPDSTCKPRECPYQETLRKFDHPVEPWVKYVKGRVVNTEFCSGNMVQPVKYFANIQKPTVMIQQMADETVAFAAACMNDRINGTIYFGICPEGSLEVLPGEVAGYTLDREKCRSEIMSKIKFAFEEKHHEIVSKVIRDPTFVEVIDRNNSDDHSYVVEIDVVPTSHVVKHEVFLISSKFPIGKKNKQRLFRYTDGTIKRHDGRDLVHFTSKTVMDLTTLRQTQEAKTQAPGPAQNLRRKFLNLFTGGAETLEDDVYPVLFFSPLGDKMEANFIEENLSFVKDIDATAIFDFDPESDTKGLYHYVMNKERVMQVLTTDNFDKNGGENLEKEKHAAFLENLQTSSLNTWTFCNGYECLGKHAFGPFEWKQKRIEGFRGAIQFYHNSIPQGRALVLVFLFSSNYEVMLEAADEIFTKFQEQWIILAENDAIADLWKEQMIARHCADTGSLNERCVVGIPWNHLNDAICQVTNLRQPSACLLPTSKGMHCSLRQRVKEDMCDLDILSIQQCSDSEIVNDTKKKEAKRREVEEIFFRGGEVDWWNFWFPGDHVLKRACHESLMNQITDALTTTKETDNKVTVVTLLHQPGAGGTTSARQILWDLKDKYRCCEVKQINDQTPEQIATLRCYEDLDSPNPPLVLIDNHDDEKLCLLYAVLEDKARIAARSSDGILSVFCVLLVCQRRADLPIQCDSRKVLLKHELTTKELAWFEMKNADLEKRFKDDKKVDPKLLISFNILKENFNSEYIHRTVGTLVNNIKDEKEQRVLKYLALINAYDVDFIPVPVACFDPLMQTPQRCGMIISTGNQRTYSRKKGWETCLSSPLRVLLNKSSRSAGQGTKEQTLRIIHSLLAKAILLKLMEKLGETIVDIMNQLLDSNVFLVDSAYTERLLYIIRNIIKKRCRSKDDRKERFSPFVLAAIDDVDIDGTVNLMIKVFEMSDDAIIAQQIARFYIHCKNWTEAERFAKIATNKWYRNSYLWDTLAMVYKEQLFDEYVQHSETDTNKINGDDAKRIIGIAFKAIETFRKEQQLSENETTAINNAGYCGEIRVIILLLSTFPKFQCYTGKEDMHKFLVNAKFVPDTFQFVGEADIEHLKQMQDDATKALRRLDEEFHQLKSVTSADIMPKDSHLNNELLISFKENIDGFFGEGTDRVPHSMNNEDAMAFRRRRASRLGVASLPSALRIMATGGMKLCSAFKLMVENVKSPQANAFDFVTILNTCIAYNGVADKEQTLASFQQMIEWSKSLYECKIQQGTRPHLETFLYLVLFHLPTEDRHMYNLCSSSRLLEAISQWKEAFYKNHPRQKDGNRHFRKKDATYFFLGKGQDMESIVYYEQLNGRNEGKGDIGDGVWRTATALHRLKRMKGVLLNEGLEINMQLKSVGGNMFIVAIPTSLPIRKRSLWQKNVYFVLGFGWSGPKAYDVTDEEIKECPNTQPSASGSRDWGPTTRVPPLVPKSLEIIMMSITEKEAKLDKLTKQGARRNKGAIKKVLQKQLQCLYRERDDLLGMQ